MESALLFENGKEFAFENLYYAGLKTGVKKSTVSSKTIRFDMIEPQTKPASVLTLSHFRSCTKVNQCTVKLLSGNTIQNV